MEISKYSIRMQNFLKQEYGSIKEAQKALELFKQEGKDIIEALGTEVTDDRYNVFLELYAEYRIYSAMGDEKIANLKLENFNKLIKNISVSANTKKEVEKILEAKGMMIFND